MVVVLDVVVVVVVFIATALDVISEFRLIQHS